MSRKNILLKTAGLLFLVGFVFIGHASAASEWTLFGPGDGKINTIVKNNEGDIFIGTNSGGVLKMSKGATNWVYLSNGLGSSNVNYLTIINNKLYAAAGDGIYLLENNQWKALFKPVSSGGSPNRFLFLGFDYANNKYWALQEYGIYYSKDSFDWIKVNGLNDGRLYSTMLISKWGSIYVSNLDGLFDSKDQGLSWNKIFDPLISITEDENGSLYVTTRNNFKLYKKDFNQSNFYQLSLDNIGIGSLAYFDNKLFIGGASDAVLNFSKDKGKSFEKINSTGSVCRIGEGFWDIRQIISDGINNVLIAHDNGVSGINTETKLVKKYNTIPYFSEINSLDASVNDIILTAYWDHCGIASIDSGATWFDIDGSEMASYFIEPKEAKTYVLNDSNTIFLHKLDYFGKKSDLVWWSSLNYIPSRGAISFDILPKQTRAYVISRSKNSGGKDAGQKGILLSFDMVSEASLVNSKTIELPFSYPKIIAVGKSKIFVVSEGTLYSSADQGNSWSMVVSGLEYMGGVGDSMSINPFDSEELIISSLNNNLIKVKNNIAISIKLPYVLGQVADVGIVSLSYDDNIKDVIYAGSSYGFFVSQDDGLTWKIFNNGLRSNVITQIKPLGDKIFIGTWGSANAVILKSKIFNNVSYSSSSSSSTSNLKITKVTGPEKLKIGELGSWTIEATDNNDRLLGFSAIWGDEGAAKGAPKTSSSNYARSAILTHAYYISGKFQPIFTVKNDLGEQTSTTTVVEIKDTSSSSSSSSSKSSSSSSSENLPIPTEGDLLMGKDYSDSSYETTLLQFKVKTDDISKYFHFRATAEKPLSFFVVRGDRGGYKGDFREGEGWGVNREDHLLVSRVVDPYINPEMEFHAFATGIYTLVFKSNLNEAPSKMAVHYKITKKDASPAAAEGRSIYLLESSFPDVFEVDGVKVNKTEFDFAAYQAAFNDIFNKYKKFMGADYTKYGTTIGADYPPEPYSYCADASNPMNVKCWSALPDIMGPTAFNHELGHVFTQAYPFVYSFDSTNNLESAANYLRDWLTDPSGGNGLTADKFIRHQANMMHTLGTITSKTPWYESVTKDGFLLLVKNIEGNWNGVQSAFQSYVNDYDGNKADTDGYARAEKFYLKLADSISNPKKRNAFYAQLFYWHVPFVAPVAIVDADSDGFVAGLDPDDNNNLINPYSYEFLEDGIDNNLNGYVDELVLKNSGETIRLGDDDTIYDTNRGTRRRIYMEAGKTLTISVNSQGKPVKISVYKGNVWQEGPMWWFAEYPLVIESGTVVNPILTVPIQESGVYTINFEGYKEDGVEVGDKISYSVNGSSSTAKGAPPTSSEKCSFYRDLTIGSRGSDVSCLQRYLITGGFFPKNETATGYFGGITQSAVSKWQAKNYIMPAYGYFGTISRNKYYSLTASSSYSASSSSSNSSLLFYLSSSSSSLKSSSSSWKSSSSFSSATTTSSSSTSSSSKSASSAPAPGSTYSSSASSASLAQKYYISPRKLGVGKVFLAGNTSADLSGSNLSRLPGDILTIVAVAGPGYVFNGWMGCDGGSSLETTYGGLDTCRVVVPNSNKTITANFSAVFVTQSSSSTPPPPGSTSSSSSTPPPPGSNSSSSSTPPPPGSNSSSSSSNQTYTLSINKKGNGKVGLASYPSVDISGKTFSLSAGTVYTIVATADSGSFFATWTGCDNGSVVQTTNKSGDTCKITMPSSNKTVTANFFSLSSSLKINSQMASILNSISEQLRVIINSINVLLGR